MKQTSRLVELEPLSKVEKIFWKIGIILLTAIVFVFWYRNIPEKEAFEQPINPNFKKAIGITVRIEPKISYADEISNQIEVQNQKLSVADEKLIEISKLIGQMEQNENLELLLEDVEPKFEELIEIMDEVKYACKSISKKCDDSKVGEISPITFKQIPDYSVPSNLTGKITPLSNEKDVSKEYSKSMNFTPEEIRNLQAQLNEVNQEYESAYRLYTSLYRDFENYKEYQKVQSMKESLKEKLAGIKISTKTDLSKPIGFTEDELRYLLLCINELNALKRQDIRIPEEVIELFPKIIVDFVKNHPMNEFFVISVMGWESGHGNSNYAKERNNFFGMKSKGEGRYFSTVKEGLEEGVKCVYNHLEGKKTIHQVNDTYRPYQEGKEDEDYERYSWSEGVMSVMWLYKGVEID